MENQNIKNFPRYERYKDSGVDWIGEIPAHWGVLGIKKILSSCANGFWGEDPNKIDDLIVLRVADFDRDTFTISDKKLTYRAIKLNDRIGRLLKQGDILLEKSGGGDKTLVGSNVYFNKKYSAITSNFIMKMTPLPSFDSKFVNYLFLNLYFNNINYRSIKQTTGIQNLDTNSYLSEKVGIAPIPEQTAIAQFLDHKTAQIDRAIAIKEEQIKLLNERKQIMIQEAVTKGLDPTVPMKDSGVEWIGEIPEYWELIKIKNIMELASRGTTPSYVEYSGYLVMNQATFSKGYWDFEGIRYTSKPDNMRGNIKFGDILLASTGGGVLGKVAYYDLDNTYNFIADSHVTILRAKNECHKSKYFYYYLSVNYDLINGVLAQGATNQTELQTNWMRNFIFPAPTLEIQEQIVNFIDEYNKKVLQSIESLRNQIQALKEYKTTLINEAVTGKIKVN